MNPTPWTPERIAMWFRLRGQKVSARMAHPRLNALPGPPMASYLSLVSFAKDNHWPAVPRSPPVAQPGGDDAKARRAIRAASARFALALGKVTHA